MRCKPVGEKSSIEYYRIIIEILRHQGKWAEATRLLISTAKSLEDGGADFIVLCTNTMHRVADEIQASVKLPLLHIADTTGQRVKDSGIQTIGLLGTRFTMEEAEAQDREIVHRIIYDELVLGEMQYLRIIEQMVDQGAEGVILGYTEIGLLIQS